jgi:nucleoside-diphosphate-sugar epimerase
MAILLTGANGFLGKIIIKVLEEKYKIVTLSKNSGDYQICLNKQIPNFQNDFEMVIHAAGKAHSIPKTEMEKMMFHEVNVIGTENLLKGLEKKGIPKEFVFISSVSVYGKEFGNGINEEYPLDAKDAYGLSKIKAEELVKKWCEYNQIKCTILRLPLLVGKYPPGNLGAMIKAVNKGYYFNIGGGLAKKSMVLAKDVASFISIVAPIGGIYNLTDGFHPSFGELSLAISKSKKKQFSLPIYGAKFIGLIGDVLGDKAPINSLKVKKIISDLTFDDSKARELLNWKPQSILDYLKNENLDQ